MPLADHIKHMDSARDLGVDGPTQEPYYYVLLDLRDAFDPEHTKAGSDYQSERGREYHEYSNHNVEREVIERLQRSYPGADFVNPDGQAAGPPMFILPAHAPVTFDSEGGAFGMRSTDRDSLVPVCETIDILAAEAQGEPSFIDIFKVRYDDVPPEYRRLLGRAMRLVRLRTLLTQDRGVGSEYIVGHEKRLLREAYEQVRDLDLIEEQAEIEQPLDHWED